MTLIRIAPLDAAWLMMESRDTPMHVGSLMEFTAPSDAEPGFLRTWLEEQRGRPTVAPPFNLIPVRGPFGGTGLPFMRESQEVDLSHHVKLWGLPQPAGQRELGVLVSRLHSQQLDFRRPLWELHVIDGLGDDRFGIYFKVHHTLIDGVSGMRHVLRCLSTDPADRNTPLIWAVARPESTVPGPPQRRVSGSSGASAESTLAGLARSRREMKSGAVKDLRAPYGVPPSMLGTQISGRRRLATQSYDLLEIKKLAAAAGCTLNDLVLYLCGTALRTYLAELGELPDRSMTAGIPVSLREPGDERPGTAIGMLIAELGTDIADPMTRLARVRASAQAAKEHLASLPSGSRRLQTVVVNAPYILGLVGGLGHRSPLPFSVGVSNVPGPDQPLYFNGARLDDIYPVSLLTQGSALNITCVSYNGRLDFGIVGARDALPHIQRLAIAMRAAVDELTGLLGAEVLV